MQQHQVPYLSFQQMLLQGQCVCTYQRSLTSSGAAASTALTAGQALHDEYCGVASADATSAPLDGNFRHYIQDEANAVPRKLRGALLTCVGCQVGAIVKQFECSQLRERLHKRCNVLIVFGCFQQPRSCRDIACHPHPRPGRGQSGVCGTATHTKHWHCLNICS